MYNWNIENLYRKRVQCHGNVPSRRLLVLEYRGKADIKKAILNANPIFKSGNDKRGAIRISPAVKLENREQLKQEFLNTLNTLNINVIDIIKPGPDSPSGKFDSYVVQSSTGETAVITLAGGSFSNKGMEYERDVFAELQSYFDSPEEKEKPKFLSKLEDSLDVTFSGYDKGASFERSVRRPLLPTGPRDMGKEISDITLLDEEGNPYYISLKDIHGATVNNSGAAGLFVRDGDNIIFAGRDKNQSGIALLRGARASIRQIIDGLEDYIRGNKTEAEITTEITDPDSDVLKNLIKSAFDYGYYYVRRKNTKGDLEIQDLTDAEKLDEYIGDIKSVRIDYPYFLNAGKKRKHIGITILTTTASFAFQIRNTSGGLIPDQINLIKNPSPAEIKLQRKIIQSVDTEDKGVKGLLDYD